MTSGSEKSRSRSRSRHRSRSNSVLSTPEHHKRFRNISRIPSESPTRELKREKRNHKKNQKKRSGTRSRSRTYSPIPRRGSGMAPISSKRYKDGRENPDPCRCLGIFGMSLHTREKDLEKIFSEFGTVEQVQIVRDRASGRSRGFGFIYFERTKHAARAKGEMSDAIIDGMTVRVDFSVTKKPSGGSNGYSSKEKDRDYGSSRQRGSPVY